MMEVYLEAATGGVVGKHLCQSVFLSLRPGGSGAGVFL